MSSRREPQGPPPVRNSRVALLAEEERSSRPENNRMNEDRGPPPVAKSRFAAAAAADFSSRPPPRDEGPPPTTESRFSRAAAMAERDNEVEAAARAESRGSRDFGGRDGGVRPYRGRDERPLQTNSRFAQAAAADGDYVNRNDRERRPDRRFDDRDNRGFGGGGRGRYGQGGGGFRGGGGYDDYSNRPLPTGPRGSADTNTVDDYFKEKERKAREAAEKLKPAAKPSAEHEANMFQMPLKPKEREEEVLIPLKKKESKPADEPAPAPAAPVLSAAEEEALLNEFSSGNRLGDDLKAWCLEQGAKFPSIDRLLFHMLTEREKLNPDVECKWADPSQYGAAFIAIADDDVYKQMEVLWGVQLYCDKIGFPKLNDEYVVQAMFRSMYKYDLAGDDAFAEWKEDESPDHEQGKVKAIIQTVAWFNWLEEEDEEEEDEEEEDEGVYDE